MNWKSIFTLSIALLVLAGCNLPRKTLTPAAPTAIVVSTPLVTIIPAQPTASIPTETTAPTAAPTQPPEASPTTAPSPLPSPSLTPESSSFTPFEATILADGLKLRTGPGYLFPAANLLAQASKVTVYGRSPGNDWLYVNTPKDAHGWVFAQMVKADKDIRTAPSVEPGDVQIVRGRVVDASGVPVNGLQFTLTQGSGNNAPRNDALTGDDGVFYAFFPSNTTGTWTVSYTAISCTSRMVDANCGCKDGVCGTVTPASVQVTIPTTQVLEFNWK